MKRLLAGAGVVLAAVLLVVGVMRLNPLADDDRAPSPDAAPAALVDEAPAAATAAPPTKASSPEAAAKLPQLPVAPGTVPVPGQGGAATQQLAANTIASAARDAAAAAQVAPSPDAVPLIHVPPPPAPALLPDDQATPEAAGDTRVSP